PFVVDPGNGDRVLYSTNRVWETTNGGDSWTALGSVDVNGWNPSGFFVHAIGLAPSDVNTIYAAPNCDNPQTCSSQIFATTNHGASWTQHDLPIAGAVVDLQVEPANSQIGYAVLAQFTAGPHVFR